MKRMAILVVLFSLLAFALPALAEQKLYNITEDTLAEDSYRPVAGKEFLVAVKLIDVDVELNTEQPISNEPITFQTSIGTLSETEVTTNIYGEAITWLTTDTTPDTSHSITVSVKDKPEITSIPIEVKNIALPQDAPTAEELQNQVQSETKKIQDMIAKVDVTTNEPWSSPVKKLKVWEKGDLLKVQELSPNSTVYIRPVPTPVIPPPVITVDIIGYNPVKDVYVIYSRDQIQDAKYPFYTDFVDNQRKLVIKKRSYLKEGDNTYKIENNYDLYIQISTIWILKETSQLIFKGIYNKQYERKSINSNILLNSGIPDSEFNQ